MFKRTQKHLKIKYIVNYINGVTKDQLQKQ